MKRYVALSLLLALSLALPEVTQARSSRKHSEDLIAKADSKDESKDEKSSKSDKKESKDDSKSDKGDDKKKSKKDESDKKGSEKKDGDKKDADKKEGDKKEAPKKDGDKKDGEKKSSGGGLFGIIPGGKKDDKKKDASPTAKADAKPKAPEDPNAPKYKFDPALISVIKDISKSLKDSDAVKGLEDPQEKLIAKLLPDVLDKSMSGSGIGSNRIVPEADRTRMEKTMAAEAFDSGDLDVSPDLKASVAALWAKKVDGLLTISIAGDYRGTVEGSDAKLGEFIAIITARTTVEKGFDIQTQSDVTYWLAKVQDLKMDKGPKGTPIEKSWLEMRAPVTTRKREFLIAFAGYQHDKELLALKAEEDRRKREEAKTLGEAQQKAISEALAKSVAEAIAKTSTSTAGGEGSEKKPESASDLTATGADKTTGGAKPEETASTNNGKPNPQAETTGSTPTTQSTSVVAETQPTQVAAVPTQPQGPPAGTIENGRITSITPEPARTSRSAWESPGSSVSIRQPSSNAAVVYPARALAGHFLTVACVGNNHNPEQFVELSFNGVAIATSDSGKVLYQVPEDAQPGYSLRVGIPARPGDPSFAINVLHPLSSPQSPQAPKLDGISPVVSNKGVITIDGHNFEGQADRNHVMIDGHTEAPVIAASPVQLVAEVPGGLPAGSHSIVVNTAGLKSNNSYFDMVTVEVQPVGDPDKDLKKLVVKVLGTQNRVRVKLSNQSKDVIKLVRGDEVVIVTSGGASNSAVVQVQRLRSGNYKIETEVLI